MAAALIAGFSQAPAQAQSSDSQSEDKAPADCQIAFLETAYFDIEIPEELWDASADEGPVVLFAKNRSSGWVGLRVIPIEHSCSNETELNEDERQTCEALHVSTMNLAKGGPYRIQLEAPEQNSQRRTKTDSSKRFRVVAQYLSAISGPQVKADRMLPDLDLRMDFLPNPDNLVARQPGITATFRDVVKLHPDRISIRLTNLEPASDADTDVSTHAVLLEQTHRRFELVSACKQDKAPGGKGKLEPSSGEGDWLEILNPSRMSHPPTGDGLLGG